MKRGDRDWAGRECTLFIFFILQKHIVCCYDDCTQIKVDTLLLSVRSKLTGVFLVIFVGIKKHWWGLRPQGVKRGLNLVGLNFWYTIWDMIWYDIALYCQTGLKIFLHNSICLQQSASFKQQHTLHSYKNKTHYTLHTLKQYIIPYPSTTLIQLQHVHNTLDL